MRFAYAALMLLFTIMISLLEAQTESDYRMRILEPFIKQGGMKFPQVYVGPDRSDAPSPVVYQSNQGKYKLTSIADINGFLNAKFSNEDNPLFFSKWLPHLLVLCLSGHDSKVIRTSDSLIYLHNNAQKLRSELFYRYGTVYLNIKNNKVNVVFFVWVDNGEIDEWSIICEKDPPKIVSVNVLQREKPGSYPDALLMKWEWNQKKLYEILPEINIENGNIGNVLSLLEAKSLELDPERKGVRMVLDGGTTKVKMYPINLNVKNVSLFTVCTIVANQNGMRFQIEDDGIHFSSIEK